MVNYTDFIHLIISVLFTGIQKEKTERHYSIKACTVGRNGSGGSELVLDPTSTPAHAVPGERLAGHQIYTGVSCHRKEICFHTIWI